MNNKKRPTEEYLPDWEQDTYQTGSTRPPKRYSGLIAFLLGAVIFLCGIATALGMMNIRLFRQLRDQLSETTAPVAFAHSGPVEALPEPEAENVLFSPGFAGQAVPEFWNLYQDMPLGIYVTDVTENSPAAQKGLSPGDIVLQVNGVRVTDTASLAALLSACNCEKPVDIVIYRDEEELSLQLPIE